MRKILIVAPSAYPLGGVASWQDYLVPGLAQAGWDVCVGLVEGPRFHRPADYVREHPFRNWVAIPCRTGTAVGRRRAVRQVLERLQPDIVLGVNLPDALVAAMELRARAPGKSRAVMTLHGIEEDLFADMKALGGLDAVIATNKLACKLATEIGGLPHERVLYAPYGVPGCANCELRTGNRQQTVLTIGVVGRLEEGQKRVMDIPLILENLERMGVACRVVIAGTGPDEARLRKALNGQMTSGNVEFLGKVPQYELSDRVYSQLDALLLTSSWETGPIVAWEAMAEGVPLVSSRYVGSGMEGALVDGQTTLMFDIGDAKGAARCLQRLWQEPGLRARLQEGGATLVRERYSISASLAAWGRALEGILKLPSITQPPPNGLQSKPVGRLDRWLGMEMGETARALAYRLGLSSPPIRTAGDEWPHTLAGSFKESSWFADTCAFLDRTESALRGNGR